jgi:hypothetical protein
MSHLLNSIINGPAHNTGSDHFSSGAALVFVLVCLLGELTIFWLLVLGLVKSVQNSRSFIGFVLRRLGKGVRDIPQSFLELTFPADTTKSAYATEQLHILLRGMVGYSGRLERLAAQKQPYSLELVGTNDEGIRFVLRIPTFAASTVSRNLRSYLPSLKIAETEDYLIRPAISDLPYRVTELVLSNDFALPLKDHKALAEHDHMAYLTGHMTKLRPQELMAFQVVAVPVLSITHARVKRRISYLRRRISLRQELSSKLSTPGTGLGKLLLAFLRTFMVVTRAILMFFLDLLQTIFHNDLSDRMKTAVNKEITDPYERELHDSIKSKLDQELYEVSVRILVIGPDMYSINERSDAIVSAFRPFASSYQSIGRKQSLPLLTKAETQLAQFQNRQLTPYVAVQRPILSSSELADLYHFPNTDLTKTEGLVKSRSQVLPSPLSIKRSDAELDVIVGVNKHGGEHVPIGMTLEQRQKHSYIIGKTGMGKTTMLTNMIYQDMLSGKGLAVIDPHGDMFKELLGLVPEHRLKDVVIFDPSDRNYPLGLNLLRPGISFDSDDEMRDKITSSVVTVFMKLSDKKTWGPKMEHNLRNVVMTALHLPNPNFYTLQRLLTEKRYQKQVAKDLSDPVLKQFWQKEFNLMGSMQLSNAATPLTNRIGRFITAKMSRHILLLPETTLNISDIMNDGKILLVNLSKGKLGEDQSEFFGTLLTALIWLAANERVDIPEAKRKDFFLYIDEFQNFASRIFSEIVSEGRKFHISLILSHQNVAQIDDPKLLELITTNASSLITLKVGPRDEDVMLPYMRPVVEKGDMINLNPHHFYIKTTHSESEDAFSGQTLPLEASGSAEIGKTVKDYSREHYGTLIKQVEKYMDELFAYEAPTKQSTAMPKKSPEPKDPKYSSPNDSDFQAM